MVGKPIVDLMETHIGFAHIRPLEGSIGVFIWILWRFSRFLTTRSLCSLTCPESVQLSTKRFFHRCVQMLIIRWSLVRRFVHPPLKIQTDSVVRGSRRSSKRRSFKKSDTAVRRSLDPLKIQTVLAVRRLKLSLLRIEPIRGSLHPLSKFGPIRLSADPRMSF